MSSATQVTAGTFELSASERLLKFLADQGIKKQPIIPLTPDASTRIYFRIPWKKQTAVAAVYPEPFDPEFHPYLDVTQLFLAGEIPVPEIYAIDGNSGIIVQEDLGDRQLFRAYETASDEECDQYKELAINLIARIQKATAKAYEMQSIASRLAFDEAKLSWELDFLLDRQPVPPSLAELRAYRLLLLEERRLQGLEVLDPDEFAREFRLMTIQRGLKATGTFSYQTAVCGRGLFYEQFVEPTLLIVLQAADWLERFPVLRKVVRERVKG